MDLSKKSLNLIKSYIDAGEEKTRAEIQQFKDEVNNRFNQHDLLFENVKNELVEIKSDIKQLRRTEHEDITATYEDIDKLRSQIKK